MRMSCVQLPFAQASECDMLYGRGRHLGGADSRPGRRRQVEGVHLGFEASSYMLEQLREQPQQHFSSPPGSSHNGSLDGVQLSVRVKGLKTQESITAVVMRADLRMV
mmetsp:Transcript_65164/g.121473  ORF Transcript_65164/g.121473 Transcript_65164/m.121473 type:complete len:107 (+) Transcript_65164:969-1289(+)